MASTPQARTVEVSPKSATSLLVDADDDRASLAARVEYLEKTSRWQSTTLLFVGSLLGLLGFIFAAYLGFHRILYDHHHINLRGEVMPQGYFPETVSELVSDPHSPRGKVFFAFTFTSAICILMSWYPWKLSNVYIGDGTRFPGSFCGCLPESCGCKRRGRAWGLPVLMLRQFLPPIGMLLVACIRTGEGANRTYTEQVSVNIHTDGAVLALAGYAIIELYTITCFVRTDENASFKFQRGERFCRAVMVGLCVVGLLGFHVSEQVLASAEERGICCKDVWALPQEEDWERLQNHSNVPLATIDQVAAGHGQKLLLETASGTYLNLKLCAFWFEVLSGLGMLGSHLTIWYFCQERIEDEDLESLPVAP